MVHFPFSFSVDLRVILESPGLATIHFVCVTHAQCKNWNSCRMVGACSFSQHYTKLLRHFLVPLPVYTDFYVQCIRVLLVPHTWQHLILFQSLIFGFQESVKMISHFTFFFFKTETHYVVQVGLEPGLTSNSRQSFCLGLQVGTTTPSLLF